MPVLIEDRRGATMILTLNRPEVRNALDPHLIEALGSALIRADADDEGRAVILTGAGDRAFCAGADLKRRAAWSQVQSPAPDGGALLTGSPGARIYSQFSEMSICKPVIAAVNGFAVGEDSSWPWLAISSWRPTTPSSVSLRSAEA